MTALDPWFHPPLIAILRGLTPADAPAIGEALVAGGFKVLEVPLNSPEPFESIALLSRALRERALVGAGTVLSPAQVDQVAEAGGRLIVMPHADTAVILHAKRRGLVCLPGIATPTEAFAALAAGADGLKLFPAELLTPAVLKAMRAVLPKAASLFPVGGITPTTMEPYLAAGATGFGLGSALYRPGASVAEVAERAQAFITAWAGRSAS